MHSHLNSIKKAVNEHSEALSDYNQRSAAMHLMLGKALDGMKDKVGNSTVLKGHLGNLTRCANALARAHKSMHEAVTAVHEQMHKSVDAKAQQAGDWLLSMPMTSLLATILPCMALLRIRVRLARLNKASKLPGCLPTSCNAWKNQ